MIIKAILRSKPLRVSAAILCVLLAMNGCQKPSMESYLKALDSVPDTEAASEADSEATSSEDDEVKAPYLDFKETEEISDGCYEYSMLSDDDRTIYNEILTTIMNHDENVAIQTKSAEKLDDVFSRVLADHGEIFWVSGYTYTEFTMEDMVVGMEFTPGYTMSKTERYVMQERVDAAVNGYLDAIPSGADDYTKIKTIYTLLASNVSYDLNAEDNQTILSVFLNRASVCQGFANAFQYLATKSGVQAITIHGKGINESHAWNMVNIGGSFYHVDVTWANTTFTDQTTENTSSIINYTFLLMTDEDIAGIYEVQSTFDIPPANDPTFTYFVYENRYFDTYDEEKIGSTIEAAVAFGEESISLKFASNEVYDQAVKYLLEDFHIKDYCPDMQKAYYYEDKEALILTLRL